MELILFIICCYLNYSRAKRGGLNGGKWALYTFLAILGGLLIGATTIMIYLMANDPELQNMISDASASRNDEELRQYVQGKMHFLNQLFMLFCGIGGYLFVRYRLGRRTDTTVE